MQYLSFQGNNRETGMKFQNKKHQTCLPARQVPKIGSWNLMLILKPSIQFRFVERSKLPIAVAH